MPSVIVLQRAVPHYRVPVYRRLYESFGWQVACDASVRGSLTERGFDDLGFLAPYEFRFRDLFGRSGGVVPVSEILRMTKAEAVVAEFSLTMTSSYELLARRRLFGRPITVFWSHGYNMDRGLNDPLQRIFQIPRVIASRLADAHVVYSNEGYDFLSKYMSDDRIFIARNTVDIGPVRSWAEKVGRVERSGGPHILTVGRILPDKDFPMLVRVFHKFRERFGEATLTIVGDGSDAERTRQAAGSELGGSIRMVGREYNEERLAEYFGQADLVVFSGAVGLSVNHALAYGVPVIAFDRTPTGPGHHPEIEYVKDFVTGLRVPEYNEARLLESLCQFMTKYPDPREKFAKSIRDFVDNNIAIDHMIGGFEKVNQFLLDRLSGRELERDDHEVDGVEQKTEYVKKM